MSNIEQKKVIDDKDSLRVVITRSDEYVVNSWIGVVCGSEEEIRDALHDLNYEHETKEKLESRIIINVQRGLGEWLREADEQHKYIPY
jgi:hypothetical protein